MMEILPVLRNTGNNQLLFLFGFCLLLFLPFMKIVFFKRFYALLDFNKFLQVRQNSAFYFFVILLLYSVVLAFLMLFQFKSLSIALDNMLIYLSVFLLIVFALLTQTLFYSLLWYVLNFRSGSLEVLFNMISYFKTWTILFFIFNYFFYYFSPVSNEIVLFIILALIGLVFLLYLFSVGKTLMEQKVNPIQAFLYLILFEIFPLLFVYDLTTKMLG